MKPREAPDCDACHAPMVYMITIDVSPEIVYFRCTTCGRQKAIREGRPWLRKQK